MRINRRLLSHALLILMPLGERSLDFVMPQPLLMPPTPPKQTTIATTAPPQFSPTVSISAAAASVLAVCRHCWCCQPPYSPSSNPASHSAPSASHLHHQASSHGQISHQNTRMIMTSRGENPYLISNFFDFLHFFKVMIKMNVRM